MQNLNSGKAKLFIAITFSLHRPGSMNQEKLFLAITFSLHRPGSVNQEKFRQGLVLKTIAK